MGVSLIKEYRARQLGATGRKFSIFLRGRRDEAVYHHRREGRNKREPDLESSLSQSRRSWTLGYFVLSLEMWAFLVSPKSPNVRETPPEKIKEYAGGNFHLGIALSTWRSSSRFSPSHFFSLYTDADWVWLSSVLRLCCGFFVFFFFKDMSIVCRRLGWFTNLGYKLKHHNKRGCNVRNNCAGPCFCSGCMCHEITLLPFETICSNRLYRSINSSNRWFPLSSLISNKQNTSG